MKKERFALFLSILLLLGCLIGCGKDATEPTEAPAPTPTVDPHAGQIEVSNGAGGTMWIEAAENLNVFAMDASKFSVLNDDVSYTGGGWLLRRGIDVSSYQGDIDWNSVAASGVQFAIIRCGWRGYTGGSVNEDDRFRQNIEGALAAGLDVGIYFYSQALNIFEAAEEATFTVNLIKDYDITLPVFFDWEHVSATDVRTAGMSGAEVTECCLEFCRLIEAAGFTPGVYAYLNLAYFTYDLSKLKGLTLWIADPSSNPDFYYEHAYWQYSFTGSVPGIDVETDLDVMFINAFDDPAESQPGASASGETEATP